MEVVVLALAALTPWAFGGVDPVFELAIAAGLALLLALWAALAVAAGQLTFVRCPVTFVLAMIFVVGLVQLMPLPPGVLGWISPGAGQIRADFYPTAPEQLTDQVAAVGAPAWPAISVYPYATRTELFRWLGLLVLFAAVRNQVATTGSLWRLSIVMLVNGCLLALFGLAQAFRSPRLIYGVYDAAQPFGPFVNRNHFAAYMNLCIALGVGILVWLGPTEQDRKQRYMVKPNALDEQREALSAVFSPLTVLHSPWQLWTMVGLALMLGATVVSLSRGGFAALFIALIITMCLRLSWPIRIRRLEVLLVPAVLIVGLFAWIGFRPFETRLTTLLKVGETTSDARLSLWADLLNLAPRFWLFGSGYGTLAYVEPITRQVTTFSEPTMFVEHAHNDYLEALIEGGILRAGLTVLLVGLVFMAGFRGLRRYAGRTPGALAVGAMTGFLAIALHSAVDFSMTTPAVAILAAIVVAQLVALNRADPTRAPADDTVHVNVMSLRAVSGLGVGVTALLLGCLLVAHTWQADRLYRLKLAAFQAVKKVDLPNREEALRCLNAAANLTPDDAELQSDLGQEYLDFGREERTTLSQPVPQEEQIRLFRERTVPGLLHFALARRACPLLPRPHMRLAARATELTRADKPREYWDRALKLAPFDPDLWYFAGLQAIRDGRPDDAWNDWRESLTLTPKPLYPEHWRRHVARLTDMLRAAAPYLGADKRQQGELMLAKILPDRPEDLVAAANILDPTLAANGPARPILDHALALLPADQPEGLSAEQYHLKGIIYEKIDKPDAAIRAYGQALAFAGSPISWRLEYVKLLKEHMRWEDAKREMRPLMKGDSASAKAARDWMLEDIKSLKENLRWKEAQRELAFLLDELPPESPEARQAREWAQEVDRELIIDIEPK
jgi:O-antigen ligase/tetratricopeptide (TPR) repeat protein